MTTIVLMGMNHKTAPVEIREQLAVTCRDHSSPLRLMPFLSSVEELFFLSTCNRVEVLFTTEREEEAIREVKAMLGGNAGGMCGSEANDYFYIHRGPDAVRHLFRVAASLDSMVVGEPQILGQIKAAYREATECRTARTILNRLLHKTFSVAKRVRSETSIGSCAVSISYAAVELAKKIFGGLEDKRVLLIGAGEMAELAAEHFLAQGVRHMTVANRTLERAVELAGRFRADTVPFDQFADALKKVDIVLTSTGSPDAILRYQDVRVRMRERRNRPLFFIDIAVPRDIEPRVNQIDNVYLYDIDDLQGVCELNREGRLKEAERAEHIVAEETLKFLKWLETLNIVPTIVALREKAEAIRKSELQRTFAQLSHLGERERRAIEILTESILKKLLHDPIIFLKKKGERESMELFVDYTQQLFNLANDNGSYPPPHAEGVAECEARARMLKDMKN